MYIPVCQYAPHDAQITLLIKTTDVSCRLVPHFNVHLGFSNLTILELEWVQYECEMMLSLIQSM